MTTYARLGDNNKVTALLWEEEDGLVQVSEDNLFFPSPPASKMELHCIEGSLVWIDTVTLEERKLLQWEHIKQCRSEAISADMTTEFGVFQCRPEDRQNISDSVLMAQTLTSLGQPVNIAWTLADNSVVTLNAEQMVAVGLQLGQRVQTAHSVARQLRVNIDQAATAQEVLAVTWPEEI